MEDDHAGVDEKIRIRDEIEIEMAKSNKSRELELKHLYNNLSGQGDADLIKQIKYHPEAPLHDATNRRFLSFFRITVKN